MPRLSASRFTGILIVGTTSGMAIPLVLWLVRDPTWFATDLLGINRTALTVPWAWMLTVLVVVSYIAYTFWAVPFVKEHVTSLTGLKLLGVALALVTGTLEELVFRKALMDWLDGLGAAAVLQVLATAIAFGLAHSLWALPSRDTRIIFPVVAATTALGAALGATYLVADRNVLPVIVAHIVINLVIEPWLLLSSVNGRWKSAEAQNITRTG